MTIQIISGFRPDPETYCPRNYAPVSVFDEKTTFLESRCVKMYNLDSLPEDEEDLLFCGTGLQVLFFTTGLQAPLDNPQIVIAVDLKDEIFLDTSSCLGKNDTMPRQYIGQIRNREEISLFKKVAKETFKKAIVFLMDSDNEIQSRCFESLKRHIGLPSKAGLLGDREVVVL